MKRIQTQTQNRTYFEAILDLIVSFLANRLDCMPNLFAIKHIQVATRRKERRAEKRRAEEMNRRASWLVGWSTALRLLFINLLCLFEGYNNVICRRRRLFFFFGCHKLFKNPNALLWRKEVGFEEAILFRGMTNRLTVYFAKLDNNGSDHWTMGAGSAAAAARRCDCWLCSFVSMRNQFKRVVGCFASAIGPLAVAWRGMWFFSTIIQSILSQGTWDGDGAPHIHRVYRLLRPPCVWTHKPHSSLLLMSQIDGLIKPH